VRRRRRRGEEGYDLVVVPYSVRLLAFECVRRWGGGHDLVVVL
jgi:hypothetical protein